MSIYNDILKDTFVRNRLRLKLDGPKSIDELAEETKTHSDSLYRLLRMLASVGIFAETKREQEQEGDNNKRKFELTHMASLLQSEAKNSIRLLCSIITLH